MNLPPKWTPEEEAELNRLKKESLSTILGQFTALWENGQDGFETLRSVGAIGRKIRRDRDKVRPVVQAQPKAKAKVEVPKSTVVDVWKDINSLQKQYESHS